MDALGKRGARDTTSRLLWRAEVWRARGIYEGKFLQ